MNIIAFLNQKGGVGKTTSAVNIGAILAAEHGRKVLLVDLDPQGNLSDHLGVYPEEGSKTIYDVLISGTPAREALRQAHGMDVLPANVDLAAAEVELAGMLSRETRLKKAIGELCRDYDYVLLDCPPSLGLLTICGLTLAQSVIVPMEAEYLALKGLAQLTDTVRLVAENLNDGLSLDGVLFCMYSGNSTLARNVKHDVEEYFPGKVFETCIRRNVRLAEAPSHEMPINVYDPLCAGADDYRLVTEEIIARYEGNAAKKKIAAPRPEGQEPQGPQEPPSAPAPDQPAEPPRATAKAKAKTPDAPKAAKTSAPDAPAAPRPAKGKAAAKSAKKQAATAPAPTPKPDPTAKPPKPSKTQAAPAAPKAAKAKEPAAKKASKKAAASPAPAAPEAQDAQVPPALPDAPAAPAASATPAPETVSVVGTPCLYRRHAAAPRKPFPDLPPVWKGDDDAE